MCLSRLPKVVTLCSVQKQHNPIFHSEKKIVSLVLWRTYHEDKGGEGEQGRKL